MLAVILLFEFMFMCDSSVVSRRPTYKVIVTCLLLIKWLIYICSMAHAYCVAAYISCSCISIYGSDVAFAKVTLVGLLNLLTI